MVGLLTVSNPTPVNISADPPPKLPLVGRYPIHFHINGNVTGSYVRGNGIHRSYNRACTIHAVSNLIVEHNVAFNIKGLSFFIEDGVEVDNIVQYNLAVYTRQSNSLLNPDIQPLGNG